MNNGNKSSFNLVFKCGCVLLAVAALFLLHLAYVVYTMPQTHLFVLFFKFIPVAFFAVLGLIMVGSGLAINAFKK